jgi:hypothetical protein
MRTLLGGWEELKLDWPCLVQVGNILTDVLFPARVRELLIRSKDIVKARGNRLRLRLMLEGPLHNLPWEYMLLNQGGSEATATDFLALSPDISIVRHQAAAIPTWSVKAELPARMLVALASPPGLSPLAIDCERQVIAEALKEQKHVEVNWKTEPTPDNLLAGVMHAHLFHFAGHGEFTTDMGDRPGTLEGKGCIFLNDGYGDPARMSADELALELRKAGVRVAFLGACRSGRRDDQNVWSSVAASLLKAELGAVVGMQYTVRDDSAVAFVGEFYNRLIAGLTIDEAVTNGRIRMAKNDVRGWGTPVLYLRAEDGVIFPEYATNPVLEATRDKLRIECEQHIQTLRGKAIVMEIGKMSAGNARALQVIPTVEEGAEAIVFKANHVEGGSIVVHQEVGDVKGNVTGAKIHKLR